MCFFSETFFFFLFVVSRIAGPQGLNDIGYSMLDMLVMQDIYLALFVALLPTLADQVKVKGEGIVPAQVSAETSDHRQIVI